MTSQREVLSVWYITYLWKSWLFSCPCVDFSNSWNCYKVYFIKYSMVQILSRIPMSSLNRTESKGFLLYYLAFSIENNWLYRKIHYYTEATCNIFLHNFRTADLSWCFIDEGHKIICKKLTELLFKITVTQTSNHDFLKLVDSLKYSKGMMNTSVRDGLY